VGNVRHKGPPGLLQNRERHRHIIKGKSQSADFVVSDDRNPHRKVALRKAFGGAHISRAGITSRLVKKYTAMNAMNMITKEAST
jgi:hypothetical protein